MQNWIVFPGCNVLVKVDNQAEVKIGYDSPRAALEAAIASIREGGDALQSKHKVAQVDIGGITLAYGLRWSEHFHEWSFLRMPNPTSDPASYASNWG